MEQRSLKNKADSKTSNSQSNEGRELARREIPQNSRHVKQERSAVITANRRSAELALKAHRAFNLSKLTLRVAFARAMLRESRSSRQPNTSQNS
ncbi:hypothetical protein ACJV2T_02900 [Gardnerella sp. Marseille-Q9179]